MNELTAKQEDFLLESGIDEYYSDKYEKTSSNALKREKTLSKEQMKCDKCKEMFEIEETNIVDGYCMCNGCEGGLK